MLKKYFLCLFLINFFNASCLFAQDFKLVITIEASLKEVSPFYIDRIDIIDAQGKVYPLLTERKKVEVSKDPFILLDTKFPKGNYQEILLKVCSDFKEKTYKYLWETIKKNDNFFWLSLYFMQSQTGEIELVQKSPISYVKENVLFIPMKDSELIGVFDRISGKLLDLFYIPYGVEDELSKSYKYQYLYGVLSKKNNLIIIDPIKKTEIFIDLKRGIFPISVTSTVLNNGKELIFIANFRSNTISVIDAESLSEIKTLNVGNGPIKIWVDPPPETIKNIKQEVYQYLIFYRNLYCLNFYSGTLTVFKLDAGNNKVLKVMEYNLGSKPINLFVDYENGLVYIINQNTNYVNAGFITAIVDSPSSSFFRIETGEFGIVDGAYNSRLNQIILLKETPGELIFGRSHLMGQQYMNQLILIEKLKLKGEPYYITLDMDLSKLYIIDKKNKKLLIYDFYSKKIQKEIELFINPGKVLIW
mgnify:CR=1 FL=1